MLSEGCPFGIVVDFQNFHDGSGILADHVFECQDQDAFGTDLLEPFDAFPELVLRDDGVPVVQRGAVMQHLLPPIYRLISGESRSPGYL